MKLQAMVQIALVKHLKSVFADRAGFSEIQSLLEETIKEEGNADKTLTTAAEGKLFMQGIDDEIEKKSKYAVNKEIC